MLKLIKIPFLHLLLLILRVGNMGNWRHHEFPLRFLTILRVVQRHIEAIIVIIEVMVHVLWLHLLHILVGILLLILALQSYRRCKTN